MLEAVRRILPLLTLTAMAFPAGASAQGALWNDPEGCIREEGSSEYQPVAEARGLGDVRVLGTPGGTLDRARWVRGVIRDLDVLAAYAGPSRLGDLLHGGSPYQLFVAPGGALPAGVAGLEAPYCGGGMARTAVIVDGSLGRAELAITVIHELFHAFQSDDDPASREIFTVDWWTEATATWGAAKVVGDPNADERDAIFLGFPEEPLDTYDGERGPLGDTHPYGAFRFVQHLEQELGRDIWRLLETTFARSDQGSGTNVLAAALAERGLLLGEELGEFWGTHLAATLTNGRAARTTTDVRATLGREAVELQALRLAADIAEITAARVRRVVVTLPAAPEHGYLWYRAGTEISEVPRVGTSLEFCIEGSDPGARPWPGKLRLAFTHGNPASDAGVLAMPITVEGFDDGCRGPDLDAPPGLDEIELPRRCPRAPARFSGSSHYAVFESRFSQAYLDLSNWIYLEIQRARESVAYLRGTRRAERALHRRLAERYACARGRLRRISPIPDDRVIRFARNRVSSHLADAARLYRRGRPRTAGRAATRAARQLPKIGVRATICDAFLESGSRGGPIGCDPG